MNHLNNCSICNKLLSKIEKQFKNSTQCFNCNIDITSVNYQDYYVDIIGHNDELLDEYKYPDSDSESDSDSDNDIFNNEQLFNERINSNYNFNVTNDITNDISIYNSNVTNDNYNEYKQVYDLFG